MWFLLSYGSILLPWLILFLLHNSALWCSIYSYCSISQHLLIPQQLYIILSHHAFMFLYSLKNQLPCLLPHVTTAYYWVCCPIFSLMISFLPPISDLLSSLFPQSKNKKKNWSKHLNLLTQPSNAFPPHFSISLAWHVHLNMSYYSKEQRDFIWCTKQWKN